MMHTELLKTIFPALKDAGLLRDIDIELARTCSRFDAKPPVLLAVAMTSNELGRGHVCFSLSHWAERLTQWQERLAQVQVSEISLSELLVRCACSEAELAEHLSNSVLVQSVASPEGFTPQGKPLTCYAGRVYLNRYFMFEHAVAGWLQKASQDKAMIVDETPLKTTLRQLFAPQPDLDWQAIAAATAVDGRFTLISGGPGTGKTTTVTKLLALLVAQCETPPLIRLAAPTGKAAARLTESISDAKLKLAKTVSAEWLAAIPAEASTLHRLLGVIPGQPEFRHHAANPLPLDVLVVDEASMVDLPMMARVLSALPPTARLILLGDKDQLASVEAGAVLGDICSFVAQGMSPSQADMLTQRTSYDLQPYVQAAGHPIRDRLCLLRKSYRFDEKSGIGQLALAVNQGNVHAAEAVWAKDFPDIHLHTDEQRLNQAIQLATQGYHDYLELLDQPMNGARAHTLLNRFNQVRVLCALHEGPWGIQGMNQAIGKRLQDQGKLMISGDWFAGRPVMITENDYGLGLYNGDIGVTAFDGERLRVWFILPDGTAHGFLPSRLPAHETAWAMTVHKSQGSEFSHTLLVLPPDNNPLLTRELLYTGITRARKILDLFATPAVLSLMVRKQTERHSGLVTMLESWSI